MRSSSVLRFLFALSLFAPLLSACGADTGSGTTGDPVDASDGKFHPPGNGMPVSEDAACTSLTDAQTARFMALGCASTTRVCPDFLRSQSATDCLQYDQGAVNGCLQYYSDAATCKDLSARAGTCVVAPIAGSAPKGCP
ncbi:MAG: hypothetical protein ABJE95_38125 [Byssovorax sp.]